MLENPTMPELKFPAQMSFDAHVEQFLAFTAAYTAEKNAAPLRLKVEHSFKVVEHVQKLVCDQGEHMPAPVARAALLAALYHDCGRFPQFQKYATFSDAQSTNHARLGLAVLKKQAFLKHEPPFVRQLVQTAVLLHNRYALPARLAQWPRLVTQMVRDADKLDIFRVMVLHLQQALPENDAVFLHVKDEPLKWTPLIVEDVLNGRIARYADLRYVNDFRLLLCTWVHEMRFASTRKALRESGLMDAVLRGLPAQGPGEGLEKVVAFIRENLVHAPAL